MKQSGRLVLFLTNSLHLCADEKKKVDRIQVATSRQPPSIGVGSGVKRVNGARAWPVESRASPILVTVRGLHGCTALPAVAQPSCFGC